MSIKYIKKIDQKTPIDVVIPAAGLGKRMKSYGPKPLIRLSNGTRIIDNQLNIIRSVIPNSNIILVCGFEADVLMNNTPDDIVKIENESYSTTNVVRSIGIGLRACQRDVLILYGDLVFNYECIENMNFNKSSIFVGSNIMKGSEVGCIVNKRGKVENLMYDLDHKWGQMMFLKGRELNMFKNICWNPENYNMFGFEAINEMITNNGVLTACEDEAAKVIDIDSSKDLEKVAEVL